MALSQGDKLPSSTFIEMTGDGPTAVSTDDVFAGKKIVAIGVPGAFTGTCSSQHLPGFIEHAEEIKAKGADEIVCITVNDPFVIGAWDKDLGTDGKVRFLGDATSAFTSAMGLEFTAEVVGLVKRSQRYAMVVEDSVISAINVEASPGEVLVSSAEKALAML